MQSLFSQTSLKGTLEAATACLRAEGGMLDSAEVRGDRFASINEQSVNNLWAPTSYRHAKPGVGKQGG